MRLYGLQLAERRTLGQRLHWLTLDAPELSQAARAGHFLLLRCAPPESFDPLLRRPFYVAAAERHSGRIGLLCHERGRGSRWLAALPPSTRLDALGLLGRPFSLAPQTKTLLLIAEGYGAAALLPLAHDAIARGCAVTLLLRGDDRALPPFLLPPAVEYHRLPAHDDALATQIKDAIQWADQLCAALPPAQIGPLANAVRAARYRWAPGFAQVAVESFIACGLGSCGSCAVETRHGWRLACDDGPVFDLRTLM